MQTIGRYEVVRSLGRGGMGQVFLARDPKLERSLALKLLNHESDNPDARTLFEREAKALAALSHPNIVTIFEIAEHEGRQFIAMEYLPGKALRELLMHGKPSREELMSYCSQVALALAAAHEAKILHRDIKPENVVVGDAGSVKVVDFGIARRLGRPSFHHMTGPKAVVVRATELVDAFTQTVQLGSGDTVQTTTPNMSGATTTAPANTVFGTPAYMAPEVLMGAESGPASDIYSLGVMVYECLAGKRPYDAPDLHSIIARAIDGGEHPGRLDDPLGELVERMIDRDPTKRPPLAAIAKALARRAETIAPGRSRRSLVIPVLAIVAILVGGVAIWRLRSPDSEPVNDTAIDRSLIAIQNITLSSTSFSPNPLNDPTTVGRVLAGLVAHTGIRAIGPEVMLPAQPTDATWEAAAIAQQATLIARGQITESHGRLIASIDVIDLRDRTSRRIEASSDLKTSAPLFEDLASRIASIVKPGATLDRTPDRARAMMFFEPGVHKVQAGDWGSARMYLEQAVARDPSFAAGWEQLSETLARGGHRELATTALERAAETTPDGPHRRILRAGLLYYQAKYPAVFAELAPLENTELSKKDQLDHLFWLGEAHWHEGRQDRGFEYFKQILDLDPDYVRAAQHAGEYAIARRLEQPALRYLNIQKIRSGPIEFALRRYDKLVGSDEERYRRFALVVLDDPSSRVASTISRRLEITESISIAVGNNDLALLARQIPALIELTGTMSTDVMAAELVLAIESVIVAGLADHTRELLAALHRLTPTSYNYRRLTIIAGPLIGAAKFSRDDLTERLAQLAEAVDAELAGKPARAAELLGALVQNPTPEWEYPERMALVRNLRAIGRTADAAAICKDTLEPALMRNAYRAVRRICGELGVRRSR